MTDVRQTQTPLEVLYDTDPSARVTQTPVEVVYGVADPPVRLTHCVVEVLRSTVGETGGFARQTQVPIEVLYRDNVVSDLRASQIAIENVFQYDSASDRARVSQVAPEFVWQYASANDKARVSQIAAEVLFQYTNTFDKVRVTQIAVEICYPFDGVCTTPVEEPTVPPAGSLRTFPIRRLRRAPHLAYGMDWLYYELLEVDVEAGVGLRSGQGADPQIMLRWSDDGGHTWSNEHWVSVGKLGAYQQRAVWRRLGRSRDRVFEISMSDAVKWVICGARLDLHKGTH